MGTLALVSIVPLLLLYCSSIVPLVFSSCASLLIPWGLRWPHGVSSEPAPDIDGTGSAAIQMKSQFLSRRDKR